MKYVKKQVFELTHATAVEEVALERDGVCDAGTLLFLEVCELLEMIEEDLGGKYDGRGLSEEATRELVKADASAKKAEAAEEERLAALQKELGALGH